MSRLLAAGVVISILTIVSLATFAAGTIPPFVSYSESTITVKEPCNGPVIDADLVAKDQAGNVIRQTTVGTQVLIEGYITMDCFQYPDDSQTIIFEVRDEKDITTYLAWQVLSEDSEQITAGVSWMPDKPGTYMLRLFPIVCLSCPMILSNVVTYEITVV